MLITTLTILCFRTAIGTSLEGIDLERMMNMPCFSSSTNSNSSLQNKKRAFPIMCEFIATVRNHSSLKELLEIKIPPKLYTNEYLYLERQEDCACWKHCLFAVLGETLHPYFTSSGWLISVLTSFVQLDEGSETEIEPIFLSALEANADKSFLAELQTMATMELNSQVPESVPCKFVASSPLLTTNASSFVRFITGYYETYCSAGLTKVFAHKLFSSLNHPTEKNHPDNIYLGTQRLRENDLVDVLGLIEQFEQKLCSAIIICCPMQSRSRSQLLHYVTIFMNEDKKELWYFDPRHPLEKPSPQAIALNGYFIPTSLAPTVRRTTSIIYQGGKRCAFYFKARFDEHCALTAAARLNICSNVSERFRMIFHDALGLTNFGDELFENIVSLEDKNKDPKAVFQNRLVSVKNSYYRSLTTGNPIGLSLFSKVNIDIKNVDYLGSWEHGELICLTEVERNQKINQNPHWQFYAFSLALKSEHLRRIRSGNHISLITFSYPACSFTKVLFLICMLFCCLDMGMTFHDHVTYKAELDCLQAAKEGRCLMSYSNTSRNIYHRYGFTVQNNADIVYGHGTIVPRLKPTKQIPSDTEIMWAYGTSIRMPTTYNEEMFARIGGNQSINHWPYDFSREEVINSLKEFPLSSPESYTLAQELVESCATKSADTIICTYNGVQLIAKDFAKCRIVPDSRSNPKMNKKTAMNSREPKLPVSIYVFTTHLKLYILYYLIKILPTIIL